MSNEQFADENEKLENCQKVKAHGSLLKPG